MKSNLNEVLKDIFPVYMQDGHFDIDEVVEEAMRGIEFEEPPSVQELLKIVIKARIEVYANQHDCFSYAKNQFVLINKATLEKLKAIDADFVQSIRGREKTLMRIRKQEELAGQLKFDEQGNIEEEKTIDELLRAI